MKTYTVSAVWATDAGQLYNGNSFAEAQEVFNRYAYTGVDIYIELQVTSPATRNYRAIQTYSYGPQQAK
jgi:hypothetical protein